MTRKLLFINGLAIASVVLFHAVGMGFVAMFSWAHRYLPTGVPVHSQVGSPSYYGLRIIEQLVVACIPAFLFVSGYFMSVATARSQATVSWSVVAARIRALLVPYLVWSAVVVVLRAVEGRLYAPLALVRMLLTGGASEVLYFVPLLCQFYLLSPLIVAWGKRNWRSLLLVATLVQAVVQLAQYPSLLATFLPAVDGVQALVPKWFFLARILWFPLGVVVGLHPEIYKSGILRFKAWWPAATLVLLAVALVEWEILYRRSGEEWLAHVETPVDSLYSVAALLTLLAYDWNTFPLYARLTELGTKSFGIYLTHAIFIEYAARAIYHAAPGLLAHQIVLQPALIAVGLAGPLALMALTSRTPLRRWYVHLFGS